jgi:sec-independent protein translocase protein TatA
MFNQLRGWEWLIIIALILLLFGAKRLPDAARGLGRSLRIFKAETKGLTEGSGSSAELPSAGTSAGEASAGVESTATEPAAQQAPVTKPHEG